MKLFKIIAAVLIIALSFSGCMDRQTLRDLSVVEGMAIDESENDITVSVQTLNLAKSGTGSEALGGNITLNSSENGSTISEAISKLSKDLSSKLFLGQNKMTVFGRDVAENGVEDNLDYFIRSAYSRPDVLLCIADGKASDILKCKENDALVPSEDIVRLLRNGERSGMGAAVTVNETLKRYASPTSDIYLPMLKAKDDVVGFQGLALFSGSKMAGVANSDETFGILMMNGKVKNALLNLYDEKMGNIGVNILSAKVKRSAEIKNGRVVFSVRLEMDLMLDELENGYVSTIDNAAIKKIERLSCEEVQKICSIAYRKMKDCRCDGVKAGEYLAKSDSKTYNQLKDNWDDYFAASALETSVECKITKINDNSIEE